MMSTNAGPFARRVLLNENAAVLLSGMEAWGPVFMLLVLMSISRTGLLAETLAVKETVVPETVCPGTSPLTEIVGAATSLVGSKTLRMIRFPVVVCPALTTTPWSLLAAMPGLAATIS